MWKQKKHYSSDKTLITNILCETQFLNGWTKLKQTSKYKNVCVKQIATRHHVC